MASATPYKIFDAVLRRKKTLGPHLMRVTLVGPMVAEMATWAPDQRVKLVFPAVDGSSARSVRKYLLKECGIAKESLNLMGYWRYNKAGG
jgi:NADPH-dependent ferric siderophore reductase